MKYLLILATFLFGTSSWSKPISSKMYKNLQLAIQSRSEKTVVQAASNILAIDEEDFRALKALGNFYYDAKKYSMAKLIYRRGLKAFPNHHELKNNLALTLLAEGDKRNGLTTLREASENSGGSSISSLNISSIYVEHRDYNKAEPTLRKGFSKAKKALKTENKTAMALINNYAVTLVGAGKIDQAKKIFSEFSQGTSKDANILYNYAVLLVNENKDKETAYKILSRLKFLSDDQKILRKVELLEKTLDNKK